MDDALVNSLRSRTPGCQTRRHFNHAGASLPSAATLETIYAQLRLEASIGPMEAGALASEGLEAARAASAGLLNANPDEIAFASSGSAAWGGAFAALPALRKGDRILVGRQEWGGNVANLTRACRETGATLEIIPCAEDGSVDPAALEAMIDDRVRLISLTWLPANGGLVNDAAAIGKIARAAMVPYFVDAGQAVGQMPVDVADIQCDVLKSAGRKHLRGPRGTALLYIRKDFQARLRPAYLDVLSGPWVNGAETPRQDARAFETSEQSVALILGLATAVAEARLLNLSVINKRIVVLAQALREQLATIPGVTVQDLGTVRSGLVSFTIDGADHADARARLYEQRLVVGLNGPAYTPFDMAARGLDAVLRASLSYLNTIEEIGALVDAVATLARSYRN